MAHKLLLAGLVAVLLAVSAVQAASVGASGSAGSGGDLSDGLKEKLAQAEAAVNSLKPALASTSVYAEYMKMDKDLADLANQALSGNKDALPQLSEKLKAAAQKAGEFASTIKDEAAGKSADEQQKAQELAQKVVDLGKKADETAQAVDQEVQAESVGASPSAGAGGDSSDALKEKIAQAKAVVDSLKPAVAKTDGSAEYNQIDAKLAQYAGEYLSGNKDALPQLSKKLREAKQWAVDFASKIEDEAAAKGLTGDELQEAQQLAQNLRDLGKKAGELADAVDQEVQKNAQNSPQDLKTKVKELGQKVQQGLQGLFPGLKLPSLG